MSWAADYQQEVDLDTLFKDVAGEYVPRSADPRAGGARRRSRDADRARRRTRDLRHHPHRRPGGGRRGAAARARRGPRRQAGYRDAGRHARRRRPAPSRRGTQRGRARSPSSSAQGAKGAADEVIEVAELLGAGVAKALNGRAVLPDDLPFVTGSIGLLGTKPSADMMEGCDTLFMVGTSLPLLASGCPSPARRAACRSTSTRAARHPLPDGGRSPATRAATLRALCAAARAQGGPRLAPRDRGGRRALVEAARRARPVEADPINPQLVFHELPRGCPTTRS